MVQVFFKAFLSDKVGVGGSSPLNPTKGSLNRTDLGFFVCVY